MAINLKDRIKLHSYSSPTKIDRSRGRNVKEITKEEVDKFKELSLLRGIVIANHDIKTEAMQKINNRIDELYNEGYMPVAILTNPEGKKFI